MRFKSHLIQMEAVFSSRDGHNRYKDDTFNKYLKIIINIDFNGQLLFILLLSSAICYMLFI